MSDPAEAFYEWKAARAEKMPFLIRRKDKEPFAMAGLWERWQRVERPPIESCTIIVTEANELVREIHDRMPVILDAADFAAWLDPASQDAGALLRMLKPISPGHLSMHPVSRRVNNPSNEGPDLLEPTQKPSRATCYP